MAMSLLVEYLCIRSAHQSSPRGPVGWVVVHEAAWAYCPSGSFDGHEWQWLGPVPLDSVTGPVLGRPAPEAA